MIVFYLVFITYILAINLYSLLLLKAQRKGNEESYPHCENNKIHDGKLFITGLLGGAIGIFIGMFVFKYRLKSLFLMVTMPVLIVLNIYLVVLAFRSNFGIILDANNLILSILI